MTDFAVGNNTLLEHLNLQNVPNLKKSINLTGCVNLAEFLANGSGVTGVAFAKGGKIQKAILPAISNLSVQNLRYLTDFSIASYENITTLTVEDCPTIDLKEMLPKCTSLNRVRVTGINWELSDTTLLDKLYGMTGLDENGYNSDHSVIEGIVHLPLIREKQLENFKAQWPDLTIEYNTLIEQYTWTFVNKDGSVLDIQYVDKGAKAVDPTTRIDNPISIPTYESTISTDFTFKGWDTELAPAFSNETVTAVYTESVRKYHVRYMNHGNILQDTEAPYGSLVLYDGDIPSYTAEETAFKFYLFSGWDKGGYVNGEKDINAVFDSCAYTTGYFDGKELRNLRPVEIYTMNQVGIANQVVEDKDDITIRMGNDFTYDDIVENVIVSRETAFNGSNYIDTGIKLLNEDRDWVIAVDYSMAGSNSRNSTLMQCYETNGTNGFRLWANGLAKVSWGTGSTDGASFDTRDMLVLRHIKGENSVHIYCANCYGDNINYVEIAKNRLTKTDATLVLGCAKADDGAYENFATGVIYWAKLWYADLGDAACRQLAAWTHEEFEFEACGFKRYYLSNSSKRSSLTFLQKTTLGKKMALSQASSNENGWGGMTVRTYLDSRIVKALPIGWQQLIKQVKVPSSAGGTSTDIVTADSYFFIPSAIEVDPTMTTEPYVNEGDSISFMTTNESRACTDLDGNKTNYWTRSPFISYRNYFYSVSETGNLYGYLFPSDQAGIRLMFCV